MRLSPMPAFGNRTFYTEKPELKPNQKAQVIPHQDGFVLIDDKGSIPHLEAYTKLRDEHHVPAEKLDLAFADLYRPMNKLGDMFQLMADLDLKA